MGRFRQKKEAHLTNRLSCAFLRELCLQLSLPNLEKMNLLVNDCSTAGKINRAQRTARSAPDGRVHSELLTSGDRTLPPRECGSSSPQTQP
ncbi:unnamed protein product [Rangifer tarandus platyrhynchus]|uniref:Uncharacterized protein n=1 Tax=Rangifer tarandus platyrhynchus TaxID=3082113 RepID=A0AC59ZNE8_RANTA